MDYLPSHQIPMGSVSDTYEHFVRYTGHFVRSIWALHHINLGIFSDKPAHLVREPQAFCQMNLVSLSDTHGHFVGHMIHQIYMGFSDIPRHYVRYLCIFSYTPVNFCQIYSGHFVRHTWASSHEQQGIFSDTTEHLSDTHMYFVSYLWAVSPLHYNGILSDTSGNFVRWNTWEFCQIYIDSTVNFQWINAIKERGQ